MSPLPRGVIGVPGPWEGHDAVVAAIARASNGYIAAGQTLMHVESSRCFTLEDYDFEPRMRDAFVCAAGGRLSEAELDEIAQHKRTLYVSGDVGSVETARQLMLAADALLDCGGLAVKVESSGVAHTRKLWPLLCRETNLTSLVPALVAFVGEPGCYYSCGMHHFGHRDVIVRDDLSTEEAGKLLEGFCGYQLVEEPEMLDSDTFSLDEDTPRYRLEKVPCTEFEEDDLFHNAYGMWELTPRE